MNLWDLNYKYIAKHGLSKENVLEVIPGPIVEQLHVPVLHVLLVLLEGPRGVALAGEHGVRLPTRPAVMIVMDHDIHRVRHRAKPLRDLLLGNPEGQAPLAGEHGVRLPTRPA